MKRIFLLITLFLLVCMQACSTSIQLKVRRAPEIDLLDMKYIKLDPFPVTGSLNLQELHGETFASIIIDILSDKSYAIERRNREFTMKHHMMLENEIARDGYYTVTRGGSWDASLGGTLSYTMKDSLERDDRTDPHGKTYQAYIIKRFCQLKVLLTVTDRNLDIYGSSNLVMEKTIESEGKTRYEAFHEMMDWEELLSLIIEESLIPTVQKIAPYVSNETRTFAKGESKLFKDANKAAKHGHWASAVTQWNLAEQSGNIKDIGASLYNQAIFAEVEDRLLDALKLYEQAYDTAHNSKWLPAISRIKDRINDAKRFEETGN